MKVICGSGGRIRTYDQAVNSRAFLVQNHAQNETIGVCGKSPSQSRDRKWSEWGSDDAISLTPPRRDRCYVYVAWGEDRTRPLYIGKARNPWNRMAQHMSIPAPWTAEMVELECHAFPTEEMAEAAEIEAIHDLNPIYNRMRRKNRAYWEQQDRDRQRQKAERAAKRAGLRSKLLEREARAEARKKARAIKPPVVSPHPRKRLRQVKWRDDVFTPDQLAIIARVQSRNLE